MDRGLLAVDGFFRFPDRVGDVCGPLGSAEKGAVATFPREAEAVPGMMTDSGHAPEVMHGPDHRLAETQKMTKSAERYHPLIDPVKADDIGLSHPAVAIEIQAVRGGVYLEEVGTVHPVCHEDTQTLGHEGPADSGCRGGSLYEG